MPPYTSPILRVRLSALGEDLNSWGDPNLNNAFYRIEEAIGSIYTLTITGDRTLTADNYIANEYRRHALILTGSPAADFTITVPAVSYPYRFVNRTGRQVTIKTASGASATVRVGATTTVLCDGTDCTALDVTLDQIKPAANPVNLNGQRLTNQGAGTSLTDGATLSNRLDQFAAPTAAVSLNGQRFTNVGATSADTDGISRGEVITLTASNVQLASDWAQKTSGPVDGATGYSARLWATSTTILAGGFKGALGYANDAGASASSASGFATLASNWAQQTGSDVTGAPANSRSAKSWAQDVLTGATLGGSAKDWSLTTGATVNGTEYAAKEYAIGTTAPVGSAKSWATITGAAVAGGEYSSKEYAIGVTVPAGSAKSWATSTTVITGGFKGAFGYAQDASASATQAAASAANLVGSSTTSQTISVTSKTFTTQAGKFFDPGTRLLITSNANPANYMFGTSTAYSGTSLTVNVIAIGGTGTFSDWTIRVSGERGAVGAAAAATQSRVAKTAAYTFAAADLGKLFDFSGGPYAIAASAATVGADWFVDIKNTLPGALTFTPTSGTVNGLASIQIYGESFRLLSDGANFFTSNRLHRVLISDTTLTTAAASIDVEAFSGDLEMLSLDFDALPVTTGAYLLLKKNGAYIAAGATYTSERILANGAGVSANTNNNYQIPTGSIAFGYIRGIRSALAGGVKSMFQAGDGGTLQIISQTESTAAILQGIRLAGSGGNLDIGTNFRVWGNR